MNKHAKQPPTTRQQDLEHAELLADVGQTVGLLHLVLDHVESHRLREGSRRHTPTPWQTCTDRWSQHLPPSRRSKESSEQGCYDVSSRNYVISPSQRTSLPSVLLHVSQVVTTHDDGALHLRGDDQTLQDGSTDRHGGSERALLVDVLAANGHLGRLDAQTDISVPTLIGLLAEDVHLAVGELVLLLVGSLVLHCVSIGGESSRIHVPSVWKHRQAQYLPVPEYQPYLHFKEGTIGDLL